MSRAKRLAAVHAALKHQADDGIRGYRERLTRAIWRDFWPPLTADRKAGQALRTTLRRLEA